MFLYSLSWYGDTQENKLFQSAKKNSKSTSAQHYVLYTVQIRSQRKVPHCVIGVIIGVFYQTPPHMHS